MDACKGEYILGWCSTAVGEGELGLEAVCCKSYSVQPLTMSVDDSSKWRREARADYALRSALGRQTTLDNVVNTVNSSIPYTILSVEESIEVFDRGKEVGLTYPHASCTQLFFLEILT